MKKKILIIVSLIGLLFIGWKIYTQSRNTKKVDAVPVLSENLEEKLTLSGLIDATSKATLRFPSSGKVTWIGGTEGQKIKKWQALASLDRGPFATAVTNAYYKYLAADANAKQVEDEVKDHDKDESFVQKNKRVTAQTARDNAYDTWLMAKRDLANATIYSPLDGILVSAPTLVAGSFISSPTQAEFVVIDPESVYFSASADQSEVGLLSIGLKGTLVLDAFANASISGTISSIGYLPKSDESGTVYEVKIKISPNDKYRLGMTGDISFDHD
ncbi:MAG: HlyD family efflux transporter periplasmic adaptor subunit [Candidatus Amesbacteria bacterium]|nr:HlyD family efflux transporter periplasmic adaptor subunit [Candidatus Amesbacteria bacterium]